jgi:hypothetical protein
MPQFVFSDPVDLNPEDEVSTETAIRVGSIVVFERRGKNNVAIRALSHDEVQGYPEAKYTVAKGDNPGDIRFSLLRTRFIVS